MDILGIRFFSGSIEDAVRRTHEGGLVIAPSGPGLACDLLREPGYREAVQAADLVLPDSGAMVMAWNTLYALAPYRRLARLSGLTYLRALIADPRFREAGATLWVMPSEDDLETNFRWLRTHGFDGLQRDDCVVAPLYRKDDSGHICDESLAEIVRERKPRYVILNVGGGVQELLGWWLRQHLPRDVAIVCTGAAIAFLTGRQADIPIWVDRWYLGWLARCLSAPGRFIPRYWEARGIFWVLLCYRSRLPSMRKER